MRGSYVIKNGIEKPVKNLGWLLRHWKEVYNFEIHPGEDQNWDCILVANMKHGEYIYKTGFADYSVLKKWLNRSIFKGVEQIDLMPKK